jgi:hypothetical protein
MPDERPFTLDKVYEARGHLYAIQDELRFVKGQLARVPTRRDLARAALAIIFCTAGLVLLGIEAFWR